MTRNRAKEEDWDAGHERTNKGMRKGNMKCATGSESRSSAVRLLLRLRLQFHLVQGSGGEIVGVLPELGTAARFCKAAPYGTHAFTIGQQ